MLKPTLFFVTPELQQVLDNLPADGPRSRLDPFRAFILRWRREGRTYRKIQEILAVECKVRVHHETLRRFINRRVRPRTPQPEPEIEQPLVQPAAERVSQLILPRQSPTPGQDPYAEQRERMRRHKAEPPPPLKRRLFEISEEDLDPTKPYRMLPPSNPKEN